MPGAVVNGGLIDFQDNLQRGVQEYVTPSMILQANCGGGLLNPCVGVSLPMNNSIGAQQNGFMQQNSSNSGGAFSTQGGVQGGILCGPASYLHVNGVTYKPVEEPNAKISAQEPASSKPLSGSRAAEGDEPGPRMLSKRELQQAIDERVKSQVKTYMRNQQACDSDLDGDACGTRLSSASHYSPEDLAARRVADLNAGMPVGRSGGKGGKAGRMIQSRW